MVNLFLLKEFGARIKNLRTQNEWSQGELADKTGFHRTYIGMIERGERNPSLENIYKIASAFQITLSELFKEVI